MSVRAVVILNDYCHINGGASRVAIDEAASLAATGLRVIFFGAVGPICKELQHGNIKVICLNQPELIEVGKYPSVMLQGLWNRGARKRMNELLKTLDPRSTVIHLHGYTKALTTAPVRVAVRRGFKVVCTLHDFFIGCPNGGFFNYPQRKPCPKRGLSLDCIFTNCDKRNYLHKFYRVLRAIVQKNFGMLPGGVKYYITLSKRSSDLLKPYLPKKAWHHPLENIIEIEKAEPVDVTANTSVVAVGRLDVEKGIELLLKAASNASVPLTLIGDGPLRAKAEAFGVRVTGWLKPEQVKEELKKARCLVFPSLWYETYGLAVAEAAALGIPAIVSDISAASERVSNGVQGWVARAGDLEDLMRCLSATENNTMLKAMGRAAYTRFWENPPTREAHTGGLLHVYDLMLRSAA